MAEALQALGRGEADRLLSPLADLVSDAGAAIRRLESAHREFRTKPDRTPVTAADEAAEEILRRELARVLPGVPVIAEEAIARGERSHPGAIFCLVDPLDGTREFIAGRTEYSVNLALVVGRVPVVGLLYAPALGCLYAAAEGRAIRSKLAAGERFQADAAAPIRARPRPRLLTALISRSHLNAATESFLDRLPVRERIALGSSLKFARIAEGAADVYPRLGAVSEWDVAAGHAVLSAAGGSVTAPDGAALTYGNVDVAYRVDGFVAWGAPAG